MAQMTKLALAQSLKQLMCERTLDKITVKEVVGRCGVNRQTFYYHFRDIYDLLDWMFVNEGEEFAKRYPRIDIDDDGQTAIRSICRYLKDNQRMMENVYHSLGRELLDQYLCREIHTLLHGPLEMKALQIGATREDCEFLIDFYKHAFVGSALDWIQRGMKGDVEEIVRRFVPLLNGTFEMALRRMAMSR